MNYNKILKGITALLMLGFLGACDDDFSNVGSDIVGGEDHNLQSYVTENVIAYNHATGPVQTNGYSLNGLGIIDNPGFGKTIASYVTQLKFPAGTNPTVNIVAPTVTRVELTVPYFSTLKGTNEQGTNIYELDSLYTVNNAKFKLSIYESGYYMTDFDPSTNFEQAQRYYSDMYQTIDNAKIGTRLNDDFASIENDDFYFSDAEQYSYELVDGEPKIKERFAPMMKIKLNKQFFIDKIFNAPSGTMDTDNTFKNYFKGLFFKVEDTGYGTHYNQLDFSKGKITIYYTTLSNDNVITDEQQLILYLGGNAASLYNTQFNPDYLSAIQAANQSAGDEKLYLKGGHGSMAFVDIFTGEDSDNDGISDELAQLQQKAKDENWLINDANLVFYVDQQAMAAVPYHAHRIFMYNAEEKLPLADYYSDLTTVSGYPKYNKYVHGGIVEYKDNKPYKIKIRITKHIQNLLKADQAKNQKLGLAVTESINVIAMAMLKDASSYPTTSPYKYIPASSVMSPAGIILYGNNTSNLDKKLKLEILYTKP